MVIPFISFYIMMYKSRSSKPAANLDVSFWNRAERNVRTSETKVAPCCHFFQMTIALDVELCRCNDSN